MAKTSAYTIRLTIPRRFSYLGRSASSISGVDIGSRNIGQRIIESKWILGRVLQVLQSVMSSLLLGVTLLATTSYSYPHAWQDEIITNFDGIDHLTAFKDWQQHFDKRYEDIDEERHRFMVFLDNWKLINDHNIGGQYNYTMKMNQFGDMTYTEFLHYVHGHTESCLKHRNDAVYKVGGDMTFGSSDSEYDGVIPSALDWTNVNGSSYVTPVKDQSMCSLHFYKLHECSSYH